jgi:hypothetical protein
MVRNIKNYCCTICDYNTSILQNYNKHLLALKHKTNTNNVFLEINGNIKNEEKVFYCELCKFQCKHKSNYDTHLLTEKHKKNINGIDNEPRNICSKCNKEYMNYSGLWKHKKHCGIPDVEKQHEEPEKLQNIFIQSNLITPELFMEVFKESKELQNVLIEQNKELQNKLLEKETELYNKLLEQNADHHKQIVELAKTHSVVNNNNNTTNNNQFNLQFYLNETCKDAMNIVDFVNSLQLTTDDFETTGKLGFVDGISRIFIKELKKIDTEKLPIHCTDFKRETVYIKDNNIWEKENDEKKKLKWTIDRIAQLNYNQIHQWQEKYPECKENNTKANEHFFGLVKVALGGRGKEEGDKFCDKIMKNVLKEVVLDKQSKVLK